MSTTHGDPTPQAAPVEWHTVPPVVPDGDLGFQPTSYTSTAPSPRSATAP